MKCADDPVADLDPRHPVADGRDLAGAVGEWHDAGLRRTAAAAFEHHQIAVIEGTRPHPHQDLFRPRSRVLAHTRHDPVNAAKAADVIRFHLFCPRSLAILDCELSGISDRGFPIGLSAELAAASPAQLNLDRTVSLLRTSRCSAGNGDRRNVTHGLRLDLTATTASAVSRLLIPFNASRRPARNIPYRS